MNHSLKPWNTFGIERSARTIVRAETEQQLLSAWQTAVAAGEPTLILGEGSNVLFLNDYAGTVILNRIMGIEVSETPEAWCLHVGWRKLASTGAVHATACDARSGKFGIDPWLRRIFADSEYWRLRCRAPAGLQLCGLH